MAAGAIADKILKEKLGCRTVSWVSSVGKIEVPKEFQEEFCNFGMWNDRIDKNPPTREEVDVIGGLEIFEEKEKKEKIIVDYKKNVYSL